MAQGNTADVGVIYLNIFGSGAAEDVTEAIEDDGVGFVGAKAILVRQDNQFNNSHYCLGNSSIGLRE